MGKTGNGLVLPSASELLTTVTQTQIANWEHFWSKIPHQDVTNKRSQHLPPPFLMTFFKSQESSAHLCLWRAPFYQKLNLVWKSHEMLRLILLWLALAAKFTYSNTCKRLHTLFPRRNENNNLCLSSHQPFQHITNNRRATSVMFDEAAEPLSATTTAKSGRGCEITICLLFLE